MRAGLGCTTLAFGAGWALDVSIPFQDGQVDFSFNSAGGEPTFWVYAVGIVGLGLLILGFCWEFFSLQGRKKAPRSQEGCRRRNSGTA